jgi:hypothetical protein
MRIEKKEKPTKVKKFHTLLIRLPLPLLERVIRQQNRLGCSAGTLAKMALIMFVEEEEFKESHPREKKAEVETVLQS